MKSEDEINKKITELEERLEELEEEFEETLDDEDIDEYSDQGEDLRAEYDAKKELVEKQQQILRWVLGNR